MFASMPYSLKKIGKWIESVSTLTDFKILKFSGLTLLMLDQAEVTLIYKNGNTLKFLGDQKDVFIGVIKRIELKKNFYQRDKMLKDFAKAWNEASVLGYSQYKKITGGKSPFDTIDPLGIRNKRKDAGLISKFLAKEYYNQVSSDKLLKTRLSEKGMDIGDLAKQMKDQKESTTYSHVSGSKAVSRDVAIQYGKILDCDPVDLMFPKRTTVVWGKVNTRKPVETYKLHRAGEIYSYTIAREDDVVAYAYDKNLTPPPKMLLFQEIFIEKILKQLELMQEERCLIIKLLFIIFLMLKMKVA